MRPEAIDSLAAWPADLTPPHGVLTLSGYGLSVRVWRGQLRVADGIGRDRREAIVHRATGGLRRLVVLGHTGAISFDAIRWLADVGAGYLQLDEDGRVLAAFGPLGTDRPPLRRAQAVALNTPLGNGIARELITSKLAGQAGTLHELGRLVPVEAWVPDAIDGAQARLRVATSRDEVRVTEAAAAAAYWSAWSALPLRWARRDEARVPAHWRTFGARSSPLTGGPRLAANPANALLNYLYALLEGEASIAARVVGLDPGLGVLHADQLNRDSLAADLMEPVRPEVDRHVLDLVARRIFAASDFHETRQEVCRITPTLARDLAQSVPQWGFAVGRVAEDVARMLERGSVDAPPPARAPSWRRKAPTPINGRNRSAGRGGAFRGGNAPRVSARRSCVECGSPTRGGRGTCSDACEEAARAHGLGAFVAAGTEVLRRRHAEGAAALTEEGRGRLRVAASDRVAEARDWQRGHKWPKDPDAFGRDVLPRLADVPVRELVEATGLSENYCRSIKKGLVVPHPMWWERLGTVADQPRARTMR